MAECRNSGKDDNSRSWRRHPNMRNYINQCFLLFLKQQSLTSWLNELWPRDLNRMSKHYACSTQRQIGWHVINPTHDKSWPDLGTPKTHTARTLQRNRSIKCGEMEFHELNPEIRSSHPALQYYIICPRLLCCLLAHSSRHRDSSCTQALSHRAFPPTSPSHRLHCCLDSRVLHWNGLGYLCGLEIDWLNLWTFDRWILLICVWY